METLEQHLMQLRNELIDVQNQVESRVTHSVLIESVNKIQFVLNNAPKKILTTKIQPHVYTKRT